MPDGRQGTPTSTWRSAKWHSSCQQTKALDGLTFSHYPSRHGSLILYDSSLKRIGQFASQILGKIHQQFFVYQIALRTIRQEEAAACDRMDLVFYPNRRRKAAEQKSSRLQYAPGATQHCLKVFVVTREVKYSTAQHDLGDIVWKRGCFNGLHTKVIGRQEWPKAADILYGARVGVYAKDYLSLVGENKQDYGRNRIPHRRFASGMHRRRCSALRI